MADDELNTWHHLAPRMAATQDEVLAELQSVSLHDTLPGSGGDASAATTLIDLPDRIIAESLCTLPAVLIARCQQLSRAFRDRHVPAAITLRALHGGHHHVTDVHVLHQLERVVRSTLVVPICWGGLGAYAAELQHGGALHQDIEAAAKAEDLEMILCAPTNTLQFTIDGDAWDGPLMDAETYPALYTLLARMQNVVKAHPEQLVPWQGRLRLHFVEQIPEKGKVCRQILDSFGAEDPFADDLPARGAYTKSDPHQVDSPLPKEPGIEGASMLHSDVTLLIPIGSDLEMRIEDESRGWAHVVRTPGRIAGLCVGEEALGTTRAYLTSRGVNGSARAARWHRPRVNPLTHTSTVSAASLTILIQWRLFDIAAWNGAMASFAAMDVMRGCGDEGLTPEKRAFVLWALHMAKGSEPEPEPEPEAEANEHH